MTGPGGGQAGVDGHPPGVRGEVGPLGSAGGPADGAAAEHVEDDVAAELAFPGRVLGHIGDPEPVRPVCVEFALYQVGDRFLGRHPLGAAAQRQPGDPGAPHQQRYRRGHAEGAAGLADADPVTVEPGHEAVPLFRGHHLPWRGGCLAEDLVLLLQRIFRRASVSSADSALPVAG
jgi:hypothetical protein